MNNEGNISGMFQPLYTIPH